MKYYYNYYYFLSSEILYFIVFFQKLISDLALVEEIDDVRRKPTTATPRHVVQLTKNGNKSVDRLNLKLGVVSKIGWLETGGQEIWILTAEVVERYRQEVLRHVDKVSGMYVQRTVRRISPNLVRTSIPISSMATPDMTSLATSCDHENIMENAVSEDLDANLLGMLQLMITKVYRIFGNNMAHKVLVITSLAASNRRQKLT